jgi:glucokinase-like ROK family protein
MSSKQSTYKSILIKQLYYGGALSCAELSDLTQKSLPLVNKALGDLVRDGIVKETGFAHSTGGRRPQTYSIADGKMYVLAVAMDQLTTRVAIMDMHNRLVTPYSDFPLPLTNNTHALKHLASLLQEFIQRSGIPKHKIIGAGIGMPGFVDVTKGVNHSFLSGPGLVNIKAFLENFLQLPVFIDNDSSLIALAEYRFGAAKGQKNVMVVNIGWGVGLGLIINDELFRGDSGFAGEFSHIPIFTNNKLCSCGKLGCLETETSLKVLVERAREEQASGKITSIPVLDGRDVAEAAALIIEAAVAGDRVAVDVLSGIAYDIGRGIAILIHIMNPGLIVLSGRGASAGNLWLAPVQHAINRNCIPKIAENTAVSVSSMGKEAEIIGAAALVVDHLDLEKLEFLNQQQGLQRECFS